MKCSVLETDFTPIFQSLLPPGVTYLSKAMQDEQWVADMVRLEADNDTLTLKTRHTTVSIPARVERRGVAFFPVHQLAGYTNHMLEYYGITELRLDATPDCFQTAGWYDRPDKFRMAVFDDPATAPETYEPELRAPPPPPTFETNAIRVDDAVTPMPKPGRKPKKAKDLAETSAGFPELLFDDV